MFGKKKETAQDTALDRKIREAFKVAYDSRDALESNVFNVIRKNGVVALYPEGADKAKAIIDAEQAKHYMVNAIAQYDEAIQELNKVFALDDKRETTINWSNHLCTSHEIVENVYFNYCMK